MVLIGGAGGGQRAYFATCVKGLEPVLAAELRVPGEEPAPLFFLSPLEPGAFHLYVPPTGGNGAAGVWVNAVTATPVESTHREAG